MESSADGHAPWWSSRRTLLAAGLMAVVLLLALFLIFRDPPGQPDADPGGTAPGVTAEPSSSASASPRGDDVVPRTTPPPVSWQVYKTLALPVSTSAGPRSVNGDLATGYAHTPTGALVAAAQLSVRYSLANDWRRVLDRSVAPGPGRDVWAATRAKYGAFADPAPGTFCQVAGYMYVDYTPDRAVIQMADRCPNSKLQSILTTVTWQDGDWKLVLQPDGGVGPDQPALSSLDGYVVWGGV